MNGVGFDRPVDPSEAALVTPVVIAARICGHHVLTCGSESRTAALNTVHMSIATCRCP
jgi:hypothetical protein